LRSFPFHFGLYVLAGLIVLLLTGGIAIAAGATVSADGGPVSKVLYHLTYLAGYVGLGLGLGGAAALLIRRTFNLDYREYTKKADYFNLALFIVTLLIALLAHAIEDPYFIGLRGHFAGLVTLGGFPASGETTHPIGNLTALEIALASLLLAYIPLTHMSHFFTKWFTYHHVRWSDEPNLPGSRIERQVTEALQYPVSWSASHIRGDGKRTWADVATDGVEENEAS
jgi:nitrate reductase gamma subunit